MCFFQLLGYDFLVDADARVWLLEINSAPGVAEKLVPAMTQDIISIVIDPAFPVGGPAASHRAPARRAAARTLSDKLEGTGFELLPEAK